MNAKQLSTVQSLTSYAAVNNCAIRQSFITKCERTEIGASVVVYIKAEEEKGLFQTTIIATIGPRGAIRRKVINHDII